MKTEQSDQRPATELNLREFFRSVWKHKFLFLLSLMLFIGIGILYLYITPPTYQASTTLLLDAGVNNRHWSESQYVGGGIGLGEKEKNLYNEMSILKSVSLVEETVRDLDFQVSYYEKDVARKRELYKDFPFRVDLLEGPQMLDAPIFIQPISKDSYRIIIDEKQYYLQNTSGRIELMSQPIMYSAIHKFDEPALSDFYHVNITQMSDTFPSSEYLGKKLYFNIHGIDDLVNTFRNKTEVMQVDLQSSIMEITSEGEVVEKEIAYLNQLSSNYINRKIRERNQIAISKESFITEQLDNIADSLNRAERSLEVFRREANAVNLTQSGMNALEKFQDLQSQQAQVQLNLKYYQSLLEYLQDSNGVNQIIAPSTVGIEDPILNENLLDLKRLTTEKTRLQYLGGPKSYDLEIVNQQIDNTRQALEENVRNLIGSATLALNDFGGRIQTLERTLDLLPSSEKKLLNYQRKTKLYENLYNYLSQELAKTGIARAEELPDITTLNQARMLGDDAVQPHPILILLLGGLVGLLLPSVYVSIKSNDHALISNFTELESITRIPILAQIAVDEDLKKSKDTIVASHWQSKESFRDLHANMKFFMPDYWQKVTAVTSTVPGEGKTFVAANLAMSMASAGNDVLLIDTDFRNPNLSRQFGVQPSQNFSSYLNGWVENPNDIIQNHDKYPKLDFITTHAAHTNPHRLIQNPRFEFLILSLKDEYDHIILDCPAIGLVSDYLMISHLVDIHLFIARQNFSQLSYVDEISKFKSKGKLDNLFLVLNGVPGKELKHGYFSYDSNAQQAPLKSAIRRSLSA